MLMQTISNNLSVCGKIQKQKQQQHMVRENSGKHTKTKSLLNSIKALNNNYPSKVGNAYKTNKPKKKKEQRKDTFLFTHTQSHWCVCRDVCVCVKYINEVYVGACRLAYDLHRFNSYRWCKNARKILEIKIVE